MAVSFMTLWSLWAFLLLVLFLKSAFAHYEGNGADNVKYNHKLLNHFIAVRRKFAKTAIIN